MKKEKRVSYVKELSGVLDGTNFVLLDYSGVVTSDINRLRSQIRSNGGFCRVVRNRLLHKSLMDVGISLGDSPLVGMNLLVGCSPDKFFDISRVVFDSEKKSVGRIKLGFYEGTPVDVSFIGKMAIIPSRDVLYSLLVGFLLSPLSELIFVLKSIADVKTEETKSS